MRYLVLYKAVGYVVHMSIIEADSRRDAINSAAFSAPSELMRDVEGQSEWLHDTLEAIPYTPVECLAVTMAKGINDNEQCPICHTRAWDMRSGNSPP